MKYYINVEEQRSTIIEVEASSSEEAIDKVAEAYSEDIICLNNEDYIDDGTCFYDETDKWAECVKRGYATHFQHID